MNDLTVVIPYRNEAAALTRLIATLAGGGALYDLIVVDDQSETLPTRWENVRYLRTPQRGYFSGAVNTGIAACDTDVVVMNQDIWFDDAHWLDVVREWQKAGYAIAGDGVLNHPAWPRGYVQGTFMYLSRAALNAVGPFSEGDWPLWGATAEWQARACRKGFKALPVGECGLFRHEERHASRYGASITQALAAEPDKQALFIRTPPLISVVTPCYNYGRYLADLVHSLIGGPTSLGPHPGQTFQGFELLIVDDASTDETPDIIRGLVDPWQGIRSLRLARNVGTAAAFNAGIQAAHGRYIQAIGADDMLAPDALATLWGVMQGHPHGLAYSDLETFAHGERLKVWHMQDYDFDSLLERNHVPAGIMFPKAAWQEVGGYPADFAQGREDWAFAVTLGRAGYCGTRAPQPLYLYRREGQNRTLTNTSPAQRETFAAQMRATFPDLYAGERPMACCGKGARRVTASKARPAPVGGEALAGRGGMVLMEYIGQNVAKVPWYGEVTGARYVTSGTRRLFYADQQDVAGLLDIVDGRKAQFRRYVAPPPKVAPLQEAEVTEIVAEPAIEQAVAAVEGIIERVEAVADGAPPAEVAERVAEQAKPKRARRSKKAEA